ncbi:MAG: PilZ domain-containing protein [Leptospirillia bacterium]
MAFNQRAQRMRTRVPLAMQLVLHLHNGERIEGETVNISLGGVFVRCSVLSRANHFLHRGTCLNVEFEYTDGNLHQMFQAEACVIRSTTEGVALEFMELTKAERLKIRGLMELARSMALTEG